MLQLRFTNDTKPPIWLVSPEYTIGSGANNDCVLSRENIMESHARIAVKDDEITITPMSLGAAVIVNGVKRVSSTVLKPGDQLSLGSAQLQIVDPKAEKLARAAEDDATKISKAQPINALGLSEKKWLLRPLNTALADKEEYPLSGMMLFGRSKDCDIRIRASHLSRTHARFSVVGGMLTVEDLKSSNGTYVNGKRIEMASLKHGDEVSFDTLKFRIESTEPVDDATALRPALDETLIRKQVPRQSHRKVTPSFQPTAAFDAQDSEVDLPEEDPNATAKLLLSAVFIVAAVAGLAWFMLS